MLVVAQFPIADARPFRPDRWNRHAKPKWPSPVTDIRPEFVHFFGRAFERRRGADNAFTDETTFCQARRALRFDDLASRRVGPAEVRFRPVAAFRRLYSDGNVVTRLEVGISHNRRQLYAPSLGTLDTTAVLRIVSDICDLPTSVPPLGGSAAGPLLRQGKAIARLFEHATTPKSPHEAAANPRVETSEASLVSDGQPMLLVELPSGTAFELPAGWKRLDSEKTKGAKLTFGRLRTPAGVVSTWLIEADAAQPTDLRSLRLCLLRLHADLECLDITLHYARSRLIPPDGDIDTLQALYDYFNKATALINREKWAGISQSAILEAYDAADMVTPSAIRTNLVEQFSVVRRQVLRKIEDYEARRTAIRLVSITTVSPGGTYVEKSVVTNVSGQGNIVNIAEYMNNVTNTVTQNLSGSSAPAEVQDLLKQLVQQIEAISTQVDPAKTKQMGGDAEVLSREVASAEPRRQWYEVSLKGLKEAAEAVGAIAAPIATTVKKLWPLLLP